MSKNIIRFHPLGDLGRFEPLRTLDDFLNNFRLGSSWNSLEMEPRIRIDVHETEHAYLVKADTPGATKADIQVHIDRNQVTIQVDTKRAAEDQQEGKLVRSERYYGQQYRSFSVEQEIDDRHAEARYADGVLELTLPKKAPSARKTLKIN